jgi:hypothetical protein
MNTGMMNNYYPNNIPMNNEDPFENELKFEMMRLKSKEFLNCNMNNYNSPIKDDRRLDLPDNKFDNYREDDLMN